MKCFLRTFIFRVLLINIICAAAVAGQHPSDMEIKVEKAEPTHVVTYYDETTFNVDMGLENFETASSCPRYQTEPGPSFSKDLACRTACRPGKVVRATVDRSTRIYPCNGICYKIIRLCEENC